MVTGRAPSGWSSMGSTYAKDKGTKKTTAWEYSGRRRLGCEFKIRTTNSEGPVLSQSSRWVILKVTLARLTKLHHWCRSFVWSWQRGWRKIWMLVGQRFGLRSEAAFLEVSKTNLSSINKLSLRWVMLNPFEVRRKGQEQSGLLRFQRNTRKWTANDHEENIQKLEV